MRAGLGTILETLRQGLHPTKSQMYGAALYRNEKLQRILCKCLCNRAYLLLKYIISETLVSMLDGRPDRFDFFPHAGTIPDVGTIRSLSQSLSRSSSAAS